MLHEGVDFLDEVLHACERATTNRALGDESEPAFYLVEPGRIGGNVVHVIARPLRQPGAHLGMFVGGVVIDDEVKIEFGWHRLVQVT